jgi:hypothetical protein
MVPPFHTILTHPGSAHKDEFLACSVLLALHPVPILRREPTEQELADPSICVVDVGNRHEPALSNFDHHQFPREQTPTCSLSLVLQHLGLYEDARRFCEWLEVAEWFDCRGPVATAEWLGIPREAVNQLASPVDGSLLRRFAKAARLEKGDVVWELMRMVGEDLLAFVRLMHQRFAYIEQHSELWELNLAGGPAKVLFLPRADPLPEDPSFAIDRYVDHKGLAGQLHAVVYPDSRGTGYGLSRFRDHPRFDFLRIAQHPRVHFVHARGFLAKTRCADAESLKALLGQADTLSRLP